MEHIDDFSAFLESELTPTPTSLCKDGYLWKASKPDLASALTKNSTKLSEALTKTTYVENGGAILHRVYWNVTEVYVEISMQYTSCFDKKYGKGRLSLIRKTRYVKEEGPKVRQRLYFNCRTKFNASNQSS